MLTIERVTSWIERGERGVLSLTEDKDEDEDEGDESERGGTRDVDPCGERGVWRGD